MSIFKETHILINEVKMNDNELMKPNSSTGEERTEILAKRIEKGEPLDLEKGGQITVDKKKSKELFDLLKAGDRTNIRDFVKVDKKYPDILWDTDGNAYKLTDLKKGAYFGGGAGSNKANAETTAHQESTQAMVIALANKLNRDVKEEDLTVENLQSAKSGYDVDIEADKAIPFIEDKMWKKSLINTANALRKKLKTKGMVIHRGSSWVRGLEKKFNAANKDAGRVFSGKDKWNPSDIWAVKAGTEIPSELNDLVDLKAWLQEMYEKKKVYGISLKKTPKDTKVKTYNFDGDVDDLLDITIKDLLVGKTNKLFRSLGSHVLFEGVAPLRDYLEEKANEFDIRRFRTGENVAGEISGKYAAGGKIGFGPMNRLLKMVGIEPLTHRKELGKLLNSKLKKDSHDKGEELDRKKYYSKLTNKIIKMAATVNPDIAKQARKDLDEVVKKLKFNEFTAKYQAVELVSKLKAADEKTQRDFIQKAIQYASSRDELSSVFTKVW